MGIYKRKTHLVVTFMKEIRIRDFGFSSVILLCEK